MKVEEALKYAQETTTPFWFVVLVVIISFAIFLAAA